MNKQAPQSSGTYPEKISITVYSLAGPATTHSYDVPSDTKEALVQFAVNAESVDAALSGESEYLVLHNPFVVYNPDHIVSIHSETFGSADLQQAMETARRKTGFKPIRRPSTERPNR